MEEHIIPVTPDAELITIKGGRYPGSRSELAVDSLWANREETLGARVSLFVLYTSVRKSTLFQR